MPKDIHKRNINVNDKVYFTHYNSHVICDGIVTEIGDKNIVIEYNEYDGPRKCRMQLHRTASRVVKK